METISLKALADKVLQRNRKGNFKETLSFHRGNFEGKKEDKVSGSFQTIFCYWQGADVPTFECNKPCGEWQGQGENRPALKVSECPHFTAYWINISRNSIAFFEGASKK